MNSALQTRKGSGYVTGTGNHHHLIVVGDGKRITRFVGEDTITAVLRTRQDLTRVCIVDPVRELRQCPALTKAS